MQHIVKDPLLLQPTKMSALFVAVEDCDDSYNSHGQNNYQDFRELKTSVSYVLTLQQFIWDIYEIYTLIHSWVVVVVDGRQLNV